jgi:hypothetical protein
MSRLGDLKTGQVTYGFKPDYSTSAPINNQLKQSVSDNETAYPVPPRFVDPDKEAKDSKAKTIAEIIAKLPNLSKCQLDVLNKVS